MPTVLQRARALLAALDQPGLSPEQQITLIVDTMQREQLAMRDRAAAAAIDTSLLDRGGSFRGVGDFRSLVHQGIMKVPPR